MTLTNAARAALRHYQVPMRARLAVNEGRGALEFSGRHIRCLTFKGASTLERHATVVND